MVCVCAHVPCVCACGVFGCARVCGVCGVHVGVRTRRACMHACVI